MSIPPKYTKTLKRLRDQLCNSAKIGNVDLVEAQESLDYNPASGIDLYRVEKQTERNKLVSQQIEALNYILDENKNTKR